LTFGVAAIASAAVVGACGETDQIVAEPVGTTEPIATEEVLLPFTAPELTMATAPEAAQELTDEDSGRLAVPAPAGAPPAAPPLLPVGEPAQAGAVDGPPAGVPNNPEQPASDAPAQVEQGP
jgi:hypothetical protein